MCDAVTIGVISMLGGAALSYDAQRKQQRALNDYNNTQSALQSRQKALALEQQGKEDELLKEKNANVVDEAAKMTAAEPRQQALQVAEDTATASNVKALESANALGDAAIGGTHEGNQSEAYLQARAKAAAEQTDKAISIARLFGKQGAIGNAMQSQSLSTLDNFLKGQSIDFKNAQQKRTYGLQQDLISKQSNGVKLDTSAGANQAALGGLFMQAGMQGVGSGLGKAKGGAGALDGLFSPSKNSPVW